MAQHADQLVGHRGGPSLGLLIRGERGLVQRQHWVRAHEELRKNDRHDRAHHDAGDLKSELNRAIGAETPARGAILLHVRRFSHGHEQHRACHHANRRITKPYRSHQDDGDDKGR